MKQEVRNSYVARLSREISESLTGNNFERFGYIISDHYFSDYEMINKGTNVDGAPVGHVVDSVSHDASVVTEYSSEKEYFNNLAKIKKDIKHAFKHYKTSLKNVLLLSSQNCPPKMQTILNKRSARIKQRLNFEVKIWDCRIISEYIVDEMLFNESDIDRLCHYLPSLKQIRNESILNLSLPTKFDNYVSRAEIEGPLIQKIKNGESLVIVGLGGTGKSSLASFLAHKIKDDFEIAIWLDASRLERLEDLSSCDLYRNSYIFNLLGIIRSRKCLLILDNLQINVSSEDLRAICNSNSSIIATRREIYSPSDYQLPLLDKNSAKQILQNELSTTCPDEIFDALYDLINGYPLVYSLMNANLISGEYDWEDIKFDCESIHQYSDDKNKLLAERLLGHLGEAFDNELSFIRSCRTKLIDFSFAKSTIKPIGISKLKKSAVLTQASRDALKIHDVVFEILDHINLRDFDIINPISNYLIANRKDDWASFLRVSCRHSELILHLLQHDSSDIFQYSYIIATSPADVDIALIQSINIQLISIRNEKNINTLDVKIALILETIEATYRSIRDNGRDEAFTEAQDFLTNSISIYDELLALINPHANLQTIIKHHKAKSLLWIKNEDYKNSAKLIFTELSNQDPPLREAQLQLARIYINDKNPDAAKELIKSILESINSVENRASISVYLAAFELVSRKLLSRYEKEFNDLYAETVAELLKESMSYGYDQAYKAFSVFSQNWSFQKPERFLDIFNSLSLPSEEALKDDFAKKAIANLYLQAGKVYEKNDIQKSLVMFNISIDYYFSIKNRTLFDDRRIAELYYRTCQYDLSENTGLSLLEKNKEDSFVYYWIAKAQYKLDKLHDALNHIENAIIHLKDDSHMYKSSFLELKSDLLKKLGSSDFSKILQDAIDCCDNDKYKQMLISKLS